MKKFQVKTDYKKISGGYVGIVSIFTDKDQLIASHVDTETKPTIQQAVAQANFIADDMMPDIKAKYSTLEAIARKSGRG